jgi:hypothetical protein
MKRWNPFKNVHLQWFADPPTPPPAGTPPQPTPPVPPTPPAPPPPEPELSADGTFLAQAPDKYKKDQKFLKDLLKHKSWGDVLDRLYTGEQQIAELQAKVAPAPTKLEEYQFDELKFPEYLANDELKTFRENMGIYLKAKDDELRALALKAGLSKEEAKLMNGFFRESMFATVKETQDGQSKQREAGLKTLKENWKGDFEANEDLAHRAVLTFGKEQLVARMAALGLENDPVLIQTFCEIGKAIGEGHLVPGKPKPAAPSPEDQKKAAMKQRYPRSPELTGEPPVSPPVDQATLERLKKRFPSMGGENK